MAASEASIPSFPTQPFTLKRVALYSRVSTTHGQDPELQLRELREYAISRGWIITQEYTDTVSGAKDSRPALNELMKYACPPKVRRSIGVETGSLWPFAAAPAKCVSRTRSPRRCICQLARQLGPQHAIRSPDVPNHRRYGRI